MLKLILRSVGFHGLGCEVEGGNITFVISVLTLFLRKHFQNLLKYIQRFFHSAHFTYI